MPALLKNKTKTDDTGKKVHNHLLRNVQDENISLETENSKDTSFGDEVDEITFSRAKSKTLRHPHELLEGSGADQHTSFESDGNSDIQETVNLKDLYSEQDYEELIDRDKYSTYHDGFVFYDEVELHQETYKGNLESDTSLSFYDENKFYLISGFLLATVLILVLSLISFKKKIFKKKEKKINYTGLSNNIK